MLRPDPAARICRALCLAIAAASLWLRSGFPVHAIGFASLDDLLFVRIANSLGAGRWLGPFNEATLAKGAFYPVFILASFVAGIPLKLAEHAVYLAASALVASLVGQRGRRPILATLLFAALAFSPVFWNDSLSRVIREALYIGLSLALFGATAGLAFPAAGPATRFGLCQSAGLGALAGAFWLTREEGVWLIPALLLVFALGLLGPGWRRAAHRAAPRLLAAAVCMATMVGGVMALNWRVYGVAETVDVKSEPFQHAYGALSRIAHDQWRRYVVFPKEARARAYAVSPAARELQPFFEGEAGANWQRTGCAQMPGEACGEILAPWFQWALRDVVNRAGHYGSATDAAAFYDRLAREIDAACDAGTIPCLPPRATMAPPFHWFYLRDALASARSMLALLSTLGGDVVHAQPSQSTEPTITEFADIVGPVAQPTRAVIEFTGTISLPGGLPTLALLPAPGLASWTTDITLQPGNDRDATRPGFALSRFGISTDCPPDRCTLVISAAGQERARLPLDQLRPGIDTRPDLILQTDQARPVLMHRDTVLRDAAIQSLARRIGRLYAAATPVLLATGTAGLIATAAFRRRAIRTPLFALAAGSAVAILARVALLAYVDVTTIQSINLLYLSPAAPFVIILAVAGTALFGEFRRERST